MIRPGRMREKAALVCFLITGCVLGAAFSVLAVTKTSLGEQWLGLHRLSPVEGIALQKFDHGIPATLKFLSIPGGVSVEGVRTNDIQNIGVIVRVTLRGRNGKFQDNVEALIDTGADMSFVSKTVMGNLGLEPLMAGINVDEGISSVSRRMAFYDVDVVLPGGIIIPTKVGASDQDGRQQMIIGRDILSKGIFVYDGHHNKATISFLQD